MLNTDYSTIVNHAVIGQEVIKAEKQWSTHASLKVDRAIERGEHVPLFGV